jgi:hypothetical protein
MSKFPIYGSTEDAQLGYQKNIEDMVKSLEQRYANPNWFKVAAGFLKPQLGGFAASLGSASEALGENIEQQRAIAVPLAEMKARLAQSKAVFGQHSDVSKEIKAWHDEHPNETPPPGMIADWTARAPELPAAKNLSTQQENAMKANTLLTQQNATALDLLTKRRQNGDITEEQYRAGLNRINASMEGTPSFPKGSAAKPGAEAAAPTATTPTPATPAIAAPEKKIPNQISGVPVFKLGNDKSKTTAERVAIYQQELNKAYEAAANGNTRAPRDIAAVVSEAKRLGATLSSAEGLPQEVATSMEKPASNAKALDTSNFKIKPTFSTAQLHPNAMTGPEKAQDEHVRASAAGLEAAMAKQYQNLQLVNEPNAYATANDANEYVLNELTNKPDLAVKTTNMLRRAGPVATLLAKGVGVTFGGIGGVSINVAGLEPALSAALTPEQQAYQDGLINALAKSVYADLKSRGIDPEKEGAEKFGQRMLQETNLSQGPRAIYHAIKQNDIRLKHNRDLYNAYSELYPSAVAAGSLTPYHDLSRQHPEIRVLNGMLEKRLKAENDRYTGKNKEPQ